MTNTVNATFEIAELLQYVLLEISREKSSKLLNCRLVSHPWKDNCDALLD
jgi:hypothetical protein